MSKKSIIMRQKKRKMLVEKYYGLRKFLKEKIHSSDSFDQKFFYQTKLQNLPRNSSPSRLVCFF